MKESNSEDDATADLRELMFQSPCGELVMKAAMSVAEQGVLKVSVPLRGIGYERSSSTDPIKSL